MRRLLLAIRAFWRTLTDAEVARRVAQAVKRRPAKEALETLPEPVAAPRARPPVAPRPKPSEALLLLATLQREARLVDFIKEPLEGYSDAQVGAAVREVHRDCGKVLERLFAVRPILALEEGAEIDVPAEPERYRLTGNVVGSPPFRGRLIHPGWEATTCNIPEWTGSEAAARIIAPIEVEVK